MANRMIANLAAIAWTVFWVSFLSWIWGSFIFGSVTFLLVSKAGNDAADILIWMNLTEADRTKDSP